MMLDRVIYSVIYNISIYIQGYIGYQGSRTLTTAVRLLVLPQRFRSRFPRFLVSSWVYFAGCCTAISPWTSIFAGIDFFWCGLGFGVDYFIDQLALSQIRTRRRGTDGKDGVDLKHVEKYTCRG